MFLKPHSNLNYQILLDNWITLQRDYYWANDNRHFIDYTSMDGMLDNPIRNNHYWQAFPLMYNKGPWPHKNIDVTRLETYKLLQQLTVQPILATFSVLLPNSDIKDHEDHDEDCIAGRPEDSVVKYHIGIIVNGPCGLRVGDCEESVEEGKLNVFNEGLTHNAYNHSDSKRAVLILSFLESELVPAAVGV